MKLGKTIFWTTLLLTAACLQAHGSRAKIPTWKDLLDSSDFIVWAQATKIEVMGEHKYRTTFTVLRTYKGTPPEVLSFDWGNTYPNRVRLPSYHRFRHNDIGNHYIIFAEKTNDGYSMWPERFMSKGYIGGKEFQDISLSYIKDLPSELEEKVITETYQGNDTEHRFIKWDDVKEWLDNYVKN